MSVKKLTHPISQMGRERRKGLVGITGARGPGGPGGQGARMPGGQSAGVPKGQRSFRLQAEVSGCQGARGAKSAKVPNGIRGSGLGTGDHYRGTGDWELVTGYSPLARATI